MGAADVAGGDETAAVHGVVTANAAGDRAAVLAHLETLLLALGREDAAEVVRRAKGGVELKPKG